MLSFSVGDPTPTIGCTAIDDVDGEITCDWSGVINTDEIGEYIIIYTAEDASYNVTTLEVKYVVLRDASILDVTLDAYYADAEGLWGNDLIAVLRDIINTDVTMQTYEDAKTILQESDEDPDNPDNLILVYLGTSIESMWVLGGTTWNREHVWPQSLLDVDTQPSSRHVGADLHNLKPANPSENSSRGNKYFDDVATTEAYVPRDEVKGDIARILFYMTIMYDYLELINGTPITYQMAMLDTLISWHELDVVDAFEQNRNDVIYTYQNNRNPFIDYPHLLELIYFNHVHYKS
ncbi:MAG: endonuclease I family protein [Acholeplasmataceae bacterium]